MLLHSDHSELVIIQPPTPTNHNPDILLPYKVSKQFISLSGLGARSLKTTNFNLMVKLEFGDHHEVDVGNMINGLKFTAIHQTVVDIF